jgi:hypothetical protein
METTNTQTATANKTRKDGSLFQGEWIKLDTGAFGGRLRVGGRGAEFVGSLVTLRSKAGGLETVRITGVVTDYGAGDVVEFLVSRNA